MARLPVDGPSYWAPSAYWAAYGRALDSLGNGTPGRAQGLASSAVERAVRCAQLDVPLANLCAVHAEAKTAAARRNPEELERWAALLDVDAPDGWRRARVQWADKVRAALGRIGAEAGLPLVSGSLSDEAPPPADPEGKAPPPPPPPPTTPSAAIGPHAPARALPPGVRERCLYSSAQLCQAVLSIRGALEQPADANPNADAAADGAPSVAAAPSPPAAVGRLPRWGAMRIALSAPTLAQLRAAMPELAPSSRHVGIDEHLRPWFANEAGQLARLVADKGAVAEARRLLRRGAPSHFRAALWRTALAAEFDANVGNDDDDDAEPEAGSADTSDARFERKCDSVLRHPMLIDCIVSEDVSALSDDPHFFLFEEDTRALLLAFFRDTSVPYLCRSVPHPLLREPRKSGVAKAPPLYPPAGVLPFKGFALYAAPLSYVHCGSPGKTYALFRALYTRHMCRLHTLGVPPTPQAGSSVALDDLDLPSVCAAFESLLVERDAELTHHLCELGVTPLTIAFPWLVTAFSGHIEVEQVLLLWDRIIGFGSLVPVALLAVSIFRFRRDELLRCTSGSEVLEVLEDVHDVLAIPLLQDALAV